MKLTSFVCLFLLTTATLAPMHTVAQANQSQGSPIFSRFQGPPLARTGRIWAAAHRSVSPQAPVLNFAPAVAYDSGGQNPLFVATGDLNGDGKGDLVVANTSSDTVGVLLGNGDGTFQVAVEYGSGGQFPYSLAIADVNGDGKLDLLITNYCSFNDPGCGNGTNGLIGVLLGRGDGTFSPAATYDSGGFEVQSVAVSDLNSDGKPDLVTANVCASASSCSSAIMGVLLGNGDGTFRPAVVYALNGQYAVSVATGDVNGDGNPDVAVATVNYSSTDATIGGIEVLKGNGDGTFQTAVHYSSGAFESIGVAVADVKGNGKLDLLAASLCTSSDSKGNCVGSGTVSVLLGNGDGTFGTAATYATGGNFAYHVVAADMNGDGKLDLITANYCFGSDVNCGSGTDGIAGILLGNGDGTFQTAAVYDSGGKGPRSVAIADVNGDGRPDIAAPNEHAINGSSDGSIGVLLNVSPWPASISVNSSPNPSNLGQVVTFTTTLTSQIVGIPTGTVTFFDGATSLGSSSLNSSGVAVLSISTLAVGTHSITAVYSGDANFAGSTSPVLSQVVQRAIAVISPTAINFGNQTVGMTSASLTVTLTNTGNVTLTLSSIGVSLNNGSASQTNNCGASVAAGASCMIVVSWRPSIAGSMTGSLTFTDNAPNSPQVVSLSGVGVLPAVTLSPTKLIFSTQVVFTTSASQTATLTNTGLGILKISKIAVTGPFIQTNTCGTSVAAGASCTFTVTFKPTTIGTLTGAVSVTDNAGNSPQSLALTGFGTYVRLNPTSLMFGNQPVGTKSLPKRITLSNKGSVAVSITGISFTGTNAADFAETNTCGTSVAAGASCFIQVTFTPSAKGNRTATLSVTDNGGASPQKVSVAGTGT